MFFSADPLMRYAVERYTKLLYQAAQHVMVGYYGQDICVEISRKVPEKNVAESVCFFRG